MHSRYARSLADLPLSGRFVMLKLFVRRFRCERALCTRRIFSERLTAATPWVEVFRTRENSLEAHLPWLEELRSHSTR